MNQLDNLPIEDYSDEPMQAQQEVVAWELKNLKPKHLQICALLAQGFKNVEVDGMVGVTKEYITMLLRQALIKQEIAKRGEVIGQRFELMAEQSCDVISDAMKNGAYPDKLKAARLQLEVNKRIGRPDPMALNVNIADDRLAQLANRLEGLLDSKNGRIRRLVTRQLPSSCHYDPQD